MGQHRARQIHEKEARRQEILGAAARLWDRLDFAQLSMAMVARESALAKGTLYLYFRTKEELFLAMTEEELLSWFEEIDEALARGRREMDGAELAALLVRSLAARSRLPRLLSILHTGLERNIEHLTALRFRQFLATRTLRTGRLLERRLPHLAEGHGVQLLLRVHALALGFWQMTDPAPVVKELLDAPGLHLFRLDFRETMEATLIDLLAGQKAPATAIPGSAG
jgi:AcrR family transcriptional regulator